MGRNPFPVKRLGYVGDGGTGHSLRIYFFPPNWKDPQTTQRDEKDRNTSKRQTKSASRQPTTGPTVILPSHYRPPIRLEGEGLPYLIAFSPAIDDLVKKPKEIGQINPKPAIEAARVESPVDEGIVAFHHHEPSALQTLHACLALSRLPQTVHD